MKLFLLYRCPFGHRASIVLQEKKLAFEPVFFEVGKRPPEMEAVGPYAKSPTVVDGDTKVWDSQIVIEYLEDRYPVPSLLPVDAAQRAEVRMLFARVARELESRLGAVVTEVFRKPHRDEAKLEEGKRAFLDALPAWDQRLEGRTFLVGDALSLADVTLYTVFPSIHRLVGAEVPAELKNLRAWRDRMAARPTTKLLEPN
jgi:RNA polymerase-associated protein